MQWIDIATLVAVVAVVVVISLPRLADFARRENQEDAVRLARRLMAERERQAAGAAAPTRVQELVAGLPPSAQRQLDDLAFLRDGELLRRHGYLFELFAAGDESGAQGGGGVWAVRAWPWRAGETGAKAYLALSSKLVFEHTHPPAEWSGPDHAPDTGPPMPEALHTAGWRPIARGD